MPRQAQTTSEPTKKRRQDGNAKGTSTRGRKKNGTQPIRGGKVHVRQQHVAALYDFTNAFFALFDSKIKRVDRTKYGPLTITLSPELAGYFDTEQLNLAFHQAEPVQGQFLVAHGSPIFDKMISYLDRKSAVALQQLPVRHGAGEELLRAVQPTNAGIVNLRTQQAIQQIFAFHWRITYRADDKREELYTVLLDDEGRRIPNGNAESAATVNGIAPLSLSALFDDAEALPAIAGDTTDGVTDGIAESAEKGAPGQPPLPKLPPMTQLVRLAETARKYAVYHADVRSVDHEADILPRLYKTLNRLSTYYQQQIEEVYDAHDPDGEKRRALEVDLERKLAEEVENHRLRIQLQLVSYVVFRVPVATAQITLSDGKQEVAVTVTRNRYSGELQRPHCHSCGKEIHKLAIDRNGHVICDNCVNQCAACQEILCTSCGVAPCPVCDKENCDSCGLLCWACGERACADHISTCPTCGDAVCHRCQDLCVDCGVRQCRTHLRLDHVRSRDGESLLICNKCAVRCPGCNQYSSVIDTCESSGQRFCTACLVNCVTCGKRVGPGFYEQFDDRPYCHECLLECPSCANWALRTEGCPLCEKAYCAQCGQRCSLCGETHCSDHSHYFGACDHTVCTNDLAHCTSCHNELCPLCSKRCAICGGYHCDDHVAHCTNCTQRYCRSCVSSDGLCLTCANIDAERDAVDLSRKPWATSQRVRHLIDHYSWAYGTNAQCTVYLGQNALGQRALIVTGRDEEGEKILVVKGKGAPGTTGKASAQSKASSAVSAADEERDANEWLHEFQDWLRRMRRRRGR